MPHKPFKNIKINFFSPKYIIADSLLLAGLCSSLRQLHWYYEDGVSMVLFPRCFNTATENELSAFVKNFRLTACVSMIRLVCENSISEENVIFQKDGTIPISSVEFALKRCKEYVAQQQHFDIDQHVREKIWDHQWDQFLTYYYKLVHDDEIFASESDDEAVLIQEKCQDLLTQLADHWPQLHLDGTNNLWILKPAAKSRGRGIQIIKKLEDILVKVNSQQGKECRYVAQKYIERPLLIYDTKFDIRQWFLVTSAYPLTVWMYKESYLRFCSQAFSLINIHESVHLSNNAVQCKYTNGIRDRNLPDENMWDCYTFQTYLRSKGRSELWDNVIYPGMRKNIIGTLLASQDTLDTRKGCFELFGADFMLSETFEPWLIEINSGPSMSSSTSVTARMCAQVLEDVIKDRKHDKNADTGMFELVYKQVTPPMQPYMGQNLIIRGSKIEDARTRATKRRVFPCKSKKRKLSSQLSVSMTRLSQPSKQQFRTEHCGRFDDRNRAPKIERKSAAVKMNKAWQTEKAPSRLVKSQREVNGGVDLNGVIHENFTNVSDATARGRKARKPYHADLEIRQIPLPIVTIESAKCRSKSSSNETVFPPIESPSR